MPKWNYASPFWFNGYSMSTTLYRSWLEGLNKIWGLDTFVSQNVSKWGLDVFKWFRAGKKRMLGAYSKQYTNL